MSISLQHWPNALSDGAINSDSRIMSEYVMGHSQTERFDKWRLFGLEMTAYGENLFGFTDNDKNT